MPRSFKNTKKSNNYKKKLISKILKQKKKYSGGNIENENQTTIIGINALAQASILGYNISILSLRLKALEGTSTKCICHHGIM